MNGFYVVKWWLLAVVVIAPLIFLISSLFTGGADSTFLWLIPFGLMFSLPCLVFIMFVFGVLYKSNVPFLAAKWILNAAAVVGIFLTFHLLFDVLKDANAGFLAVIYIFSTMVSSLFCSIKAEEQPVTSLSDTHSPQ